MKDHYIPNDMNDAFVKSIYKEMAWTFPKFIKDYFMRGLSFVWGIGSKQKIGPSKTHAESYAVKN